MNDITSPLVTVYIANFNYGRYIKQAIESVLNQTFTDYELIIIDDGSVDNSKEIIQNYQSHPKVRTIFQENKGLNRTNNIALRSSRAKYIMRLDADDYLDPHALLVMTKIMESNLNLGMVFPDYFYVDENGQITGHVRRHDFQNSVSLLDQPAHGACTLIRIIALLEVGGYDETYRCQDCYDVWLKIIEKYEIQNVNLPLFYYRRHANNLSNENKLILETRAQIKERYAKMANKPKLDTLCILPVRGKKLDPGSMAMEILGKKPIMDWTIDAAIQSSSICGFVVSSPDEMILTHVQEKYGKEIIVHSRSPEMAREFVNVADSIDHIIHSYCSRLLPKAIMVLNVELPFRSQFHIEKAINTMRIFPVDSVIGVVLENDLFFHHNGHGLSAIGNSPDMPNIYFENRYMYRKVYGMHLISMNFFQKTKQIIGGKIGHIVFDNYEAMTIFNKTQLEIANFILKVKPEVVLHSSSTYQ